MTYTVSSGTLNPSIPYHTLVSPIVRKILRVSHYTERYEGNVPAACTFSNHNIGPRHRL